MKRLICKLFGCHGLRRRPSTRRADGAIVSPPCLRCGQSVITE